MFMDKYHTDMRIIERDVIARVSRVEATMEIKRDLDKLKERIDMLEDQQREMYATCAIEKTGL